MRIKHCSILGLLALCMVACTDAGSTLEVSDQITVSTLETLDTIKVIPNDTVRFRFLVSSTGSPIKNIDLDVDEEVVEKLPAHSTFAIYDAENALTMDEAGNLSRDINTVIVEYAVAVKENPAVMEGAFKATLLATSQSGKKGSNYVHFKGNNSRKWSTDLKLQSGYYTNASQNIFFDPFNYKAYNYQAFVSNTDEPIEGAEEIINNIALAITFKYNFSDPIGCLQTYKMYSPDSEEAEAFFKANGMPKYNHADMKPCCFYRLEGVGGAVLDEDIANETNGSKKATLIVQSRNLDVAYIDENVDDEFLKQLDFTNATKELVIKGGLYAFKTYDGRKGVLQINRPNNFNNPIPITIKRCVIQVVSTEPANE